MCGQSDGKTSFLKVIEGCGCFKKSYVDKENETVFELLKKIGRSVSSL